MPTRPVAAGCALPTCSLRSDFSERLRARVAETNEHCVAAGVDELDFASMRDELLAAGDRLAPHVTDTAVYLHHAIKSGKSLLFEGAQGTHLDIDFGTYPFVTVIEHDRRRRLHRRGRRAA